MGDRLGGKLVRVIRVGQMRYDVVHKRRHVAEVVDPEGHGGRLAFGDAVATGGQHIIAEQGIVSALFKAGFTVFDTPSEHGASVAVQKQVVFDVPAGTDLGVVSGTSHDDIVA